MRTGCAGNDLQASLRISFIKPSLTVSVEQKHHSAEEKSLMIQGRLKGDVWAQKLALSEQMKVSLPIEEKKTETEILGTSSEIVHCKES